MAKRIPKKSEVALWAMLDMAPYAFEENERGEIVALNRKYKPVFNRGADGIVTLRPETDWKTTEWVEYGIEGEVRRHYVYSDKWHRGTDKHSQRIILQIIEAWMLAVVTGLPVVREALVPEWAIGPANPRPMPKDAGLAKMPWHP